MEGILRSPRRAGLAGFLLSATALYATGMPWATAGQRASELQPVAQRAELETRLTRDLQQIADSRPWFEQQHGRIAIRVALDPANDEVVVDIGGGWGSWSNSAAAEELERFLQEKVLDVLDENARNTNVAFRFDGQDMYFYFPNERRSPRRAHALRRGPAMVVVSAGHGLYYHHSFKDWRPQRGIHNGITEDYITPIYANELAAQLRLQGLETAFTRSTADNDHEPSKSPWRKVSARYYLQSLYPDRPDVWHSLPDATHALREYDEDIRSRPLFANLTGAAAIMHLHTNAAAPEATGTRVYYQTDDSDSKEFAATVLCSMKESIQAVDRYRTYRVPLTPTAGNYGENRLADMPSVLIEIGFHTNPSDAVALQDPVFQAAAMKGAALGYQRFSAGQSCPATP